LRVVGAANEDGGGSSGASDRRPSGSSRSLLATKQQQQQQQQPRAASVACSAARPCPNPNWACCAGQCLDPGRGLACVGDLACPAAAVCGRPAASSPPSCCTADAGVCVQGGTRCCPRERVCADGCCAPGEACAADGNGAARCRSALPRPLLDAASAPSPEAKRTAVSSAREAGAAGPLIFGPSGSGPDGSATDAAAERRWRAAGLAEDPCGRATAVLTATRLVGGAGGGRDLVGAEGRSTLTVRTCCELCATTAGCGHFSFDADAAKCWLKQGGLGTASSKRLKAAAVVANSDDAEDGGAALAFSADGSAALQGLWAVPSRAFVSGTLAYAPSPELCPQSRLCQGSGAASCCPGPVAGGGKNNNKDNGGGWLCAASGACCTPRSGPPCGSGCACGPGSQCASGRCVPAASGGGGDGDGGGGDKPQPPQKPPPTATAALLDQQAILSTQPPGSIVNYAAAPAPAQLSSLLLLAQDPADPQACHLRASGGAGSPFAFRSGTAIAARSGGALNRDRPTLAATAAACCLQCAGVANCRHFSWDARTVACSLYSDRAGAGGSAPAVRLEVARAGSVAGDMVPRLSLFSADGGAGAAALAADEAAAARCAAPCGGEGGCCSQEETCVAGSGGLGAPAACCPRASVCGAGCGCADGFSCVDGKACCPAARSCGSVCCGTADRCSGGGKCEPDNDGGSALTIVGGGQGRVGGFFARGFSANAGVAQYTAVPLSVGGVRRR